MTKSFFLVVTAFTLFIGCEQARSQQRDVVARIAGKYTISFPELKQYVVNWQYYLKYDKNAVKASNAALSDMIVERMKILDFFHRGMNKNKELLEGMMRVLNQELVVEYYLTQYYQNNVNLKAAERAYRQFGREVVYREILLRKPRNASPKAVDSLRALANSIKMRLDDGEKFSFLAKKYSQNLESASNGGLMPPVSWKMAVSSAGYDTVFHMTAGRPEMVESQGGFHIVRVDKIDTVRVPPFSEVKEGIEAALREKYRFAAGDEFDRMKQNLINERTLQWNEKAIKQLLLWSNIPNFYDGAYLDTIGNAISRGHDFVILKYSGGKVDLKEFRRLVRDVLTLRGAAGMKEDQFKSFILEAVRTNMIAEKARELGLEKDIFNPATKDPALMAWILRLYNEQVIEKRIPPATEKALKAFYRANMDSLYYQLATVNIYAVINSKRSIVEEARKKLDHGVPFNKLARIIFVKTFARERDGRIASYLSTEPPYLGKVAFKLKLNRTAGPIEYKDTSGVKQYALIKCVGVRKEKQLTYNDVRKRIATDFADYYRARIARSVAERLRKKYAFTIYKNVLDRHLKAGEIHYELPTKERTN